MTLFGMTLDQLFLKVLDLSVTALPLMAAVLLLRLVFRRAPRRVMCLLWLAVWLRLLLSVHLEVPWGIAPAQAIPAETALGVEVTPAGAAAIAGELVSDTGGGLGFVTVPAADTAAVTTLAARPQAWLLVWGWLWPLGLCAMAAHSVLSLLRLKRRLAGAARVEGRVWEADGLDTAFLLGLFRPRIYLPSDLGAAERAVVLAHERTHLRHGDHLWKSLAYAALCVHWFDPLVWVCFHLFVRDMELACDEAATRDMAQGERADYAAALVRLSAGGRSPAAAPLAFGEVDAKGRVQRLLSFRRPQVWLTALAALAAGLAAGTLAVSGAVSGPVDPYLGAGYAVSEVLYHDADHSPLPFSEHTTRAFCITPDYRLMAREIPQTEDIYAHNPMGWMDWWEVGQLEPAELTREALRELCRPLGDADPLRDVRGLAAVWQVHSEEDSWYLVVQTTDDEILLVQGTGGAPGEGRVNDLFRLERLDSYAYAADYNYTVIFDFAMDFDSLNEAFAAKRGERRVGSTRGAFTTREMGNGFDVSGYFYRLGLEEPELAALGFLVSSSNRENGHAVDMAFYTLDQLEALAPGCYLAPRPASTGPWGTYPDGGTCDVIFTTDPEAVTVERVVSDRATGVEIGRRQAALREELWDPEDPGMAVFLWESGGQSANRSVVYRFYRADGTEIR